MRKRPKAYKVLVYDSRQHRHTVETERELRLQSSHRDDLSFVLSLASADDGHGQDVSSRGLHSDVYPLKVVSVKIFQHDQKATAERQAGRQAGA